MAPKQHGVVGDLLTAPAPTSIGYNRLGTSGLKVSKVILGAMSYGSKEWQQWVLEENEALPLLKHAYDVGINTWDTVSVLSTCPHVSLRPVVKVVREVAEPLRL